MKYTGTEFIKDEIALIDWGPGKSECRVIEWNPAYGGWWYVELPGVGYHYTQSLLKK